MLKFVKIFLIIFLISPAAYFIACSSGEYDIEEFQVDYIEKTVKRDTIRVISDKIKEDKNPNSYIYAIQIGAFSIQENFDRFLADAKMKLGDGVYFEQTGNLFKIRVGQFTRSTEAVKYALFVKSKGYTDAFVITKKK
ncbi:MAG: SPOR domain-containing protein [Ignavibacteria bacterium]